MGRERDGSAAKAYGVRVGPWRLRVLEQGEGPAIVLVHGLGTSASTWRRNLDQLAGCGRVLAVDLPGFGESDDARGIHCAAEMATVLYAWCRAMGIRRAHFIGHSLGGEACLWLAARHPELVDKLVLAGSTGAPVRSSHVAKLARLMRDGLREPLWFMPVLLRAYAQAGPWRIGRTALRSDPKRLAPHLGAICAETLVLWGANDPVIPLAEARTLVGALPRARLTVVVDGAHGLIFDAPCTFNRAVCEFLHEEPAGRSRHAARPPAGIRV